MLDYCLLNMIGIGRHPSIKYHTSTKNRYRGNCLKRCNKDRRQSLTHLDQKKQNLHHQHNVYSGTNLTKNLVKLLLVQ